MTPPSDLELLRRFEPVVRYTKGEWFYPIDTAAYLPFCGLWTQRPGGVAECLVPAGGVTAESLAEPRPDEFNAVHFLKIEDPLRDARPRAHRKRRRDLHRQARASFHAGRGRLARVGFGSRLVDALLSLSLLARGRVPGAMATAAIDAYRRTMTESPRYRYHGRVLRQEGWIVLQYWFFFFFNDWRSSFNGANDHESDWEMVCVYLADSGSAPLEPAWAAYASHDDAGDDLRRRWDDPELQREGEHPVVFAGAGSHASYYTPGEYLTQLEIPGLKPLSRATDRLSAIWHRTLRQYGAAEEEGSAGAGGGAQNLFRIPFVDYARGDGLSLGPGQEQEWDDPVLLSPPPAWTSRYRGLWGYFANDPASGEDAPSGPMYNRDGTVRHSWFDPVGWAGLDKTAAPGEEARHAESQRRTVRDRAAEGQRALDEKKERLQGLEVEAAAMRGRPHFRRVFTAHQKEIAELSAEIVKVRSDLAQEQSLLDSLEDYALRLNRGERDPARAHIQRARQPSSQADISGSRITEVWAAVSLGLMLLGIVVVYFFAKSYLIWWLAVVLTGFIFMEAGFRGRLTRLITSVTVSLAIVGTLVILYRFFWLFVVLAVLVAGIYMLWDNLRELRR